MTGEKKPESLAERHERWRNRQTCSFIDEPDAIAIFTPAILNKEAMGSFRTTFSYVSKQTYRDRIVIDTVNTENFNALGIALLLMEVHIAEVEGIKTFDPDNNRLPVTFRNLNEEVISILEDTDFGQFIER